jgi:hypothetical protein
MYLLVACCGRSAQSPGNSRPAGRHERTWQQRRRSNAGQLLYLYVRSSSCAPMPRRAALSAGLTSSTCTSTFELHLYVECLSPQYTRPAEPVWCDHTQPCMYVHCLAHVLSASCYSSRHAPSSRSPASCPPASRTPDAADGHDSGDGCGDSILVSSGTCTAARVRHHRPGLSANMKHLYTKTSSFPCELHGGDLAPGLCVRRAPPVHRRRAVPTPSARPNLYAELSRLPVEAEPVPRLSAVLVDLHLYTEPSVGRECCLPSRMSHGLGGTAPRSRTP